MLNSGFSFPEFTVTRKRKTLEVTVSTTVAKEEEDEVMRRYKADQSQLLRPTT